MDGVKETLLMIDTYVAIAVALYVVVLGALTVVPWFPHVACGVLFVFLIPVVGNVAILVTAIVLHVRHRRAFS